MVSVARLFLVAVTTFGVVRPALAQPVATGAWFRRAIEQDQGLPETQVNAVAQTPDGYLWLGTRRGVVRYDGVNFTTFAPDRYPALPAFWINGLTVDRRGRLWVATDRGLALRESSGEFRRIDSTQVPLRNTWRVLEDGDSYLVATSTGVYRGDGERFRRITGPEYAYALARDADGRIWVAGRNLLARVDGDVVQRVPISGWTDDPDVLDILPDGARGLWAATRAGVVQLSLSAQGAKVTRRIDATRAGIPSAVWSLGASPDGRLWIGSANHGVLTWDGRRLRQEEPGSTEQVWAFHLDTRGRMWAGTGAGLERYQRSAFTTYGDLRPTRSAWSIRPGPEGDLWTATASGAVYRFRDGEHHEVLPPSPRQVSPATWPAPGNGVYVTRELRRVLQVSRSGVTDLSARYQLAAGDIVGIFRDSKGSMWFSTDSGLFRSDGGPARRVDAELGRSGDTNPRDIREDASGRLLIGRPGLTVIEGARQTRYGAREGLTDEEVLVLYPQGENVWIGTSDSGLYVLRKDRVVGLGHLDARLHREILGIAEDTTGHLWLSSSFGLTRVSVQELEAAVDGRGAPLQVRSFDRRDGLPTTEFNGDFQGAIHRDANGHLWFPSYLGAVRVDPTAVHADTIPPQVHVERLQVNGRPVAWDRALALDPGVERIELTFAVTDAVEPSRVRVQYRMEGISTAWIDAGTRRTLAFGPLRGGRYDLQVRAANEEGGWTPRMATLTIHVASTWYERPWFLPAVVMTGVLITLAGARARQRRLVQRGVMLEKEVRARTADLENARATLERRVEARTAQLAGELAERKRLEKQLVEAQKLESLGRLAGGVAHEINNSMTGVLGFTELAEHAARGHPALLGDLAEIRRAGERVAGITRQLLAFARRQATSRAVVDLGPLVERMERSMQQLVGESCSLVLEIAPGLPCVRADLSQVEQVILNLVMNARDAMPDGGVITLQLKAEEVTQPRAVGSSEVPPGPYLHLTVADQGVGMPEAVLSRLFEPFFTTKEVDKGTGLGLAVCHGIITQHGGAIAAASTLGEGSRLHVWLPATAERPASTSDGPQVVDGDETILLVEDEASVREVARRGLQHHGYRVIEATDGVEALARLAAAGARVHLVLTDVVMPNMDGLALARAIRKGGHEMPIVFMSGYIGHEPEVEAQLAELGPTLTKPFSREDLLQGVRHALDMELLGRPTPGRYQSL
ncbi:MAG: response regulator [Gemmatimonadetes bacterium]|nr:response regulator [Gemmatimonadota bacterium]